MSKQSHAIAGENNKSATIHPVRLEVTRRGWKRLCQNRRRRIASISGVGVLTACVLLTVVARVRNRADAKSLVSAVSADRLNTAATSDTPPVRPSPKSNAGPAPRASTDDPLEVENIILTRFGFEPNSITRSSAEFLLSVENRSPLGDIELHLDRVAGFRLHQQQVAKERPDWRDFFTLEPGDYVLSEANHPDWVCKIRITAR